MSEPTTPVTEGSPFFLVLFLIPCALTYIPGLGFIPGAYIILYALMIVACYFRGRAINKIWLILFPVLAALFDIVPLLNFIPLVPTLMNIAAIVTGLRNRSNNS